MFRFQDYIFVLWGDQFEALAATAFVTELREAGLKVKLVSFDRARITGNHGLTLVPDLTLEQILPLASKTISVIIPSGSLGAKLLENDPRLADFFRQAHSSGAQFVIGQASNLTNMNFFPPSIDNITTYPDREDLIPFARQLATSLSAGY
jgi:transcriptional regulator GlxA family with amidase domain